MRAQFNDDLLPHPYTTPQRLHLALLRLRLPDAEPRYGVVDRQGHFEGRSGRGVALVDVRQLAAGSAIRAARAAVLGAFRQNIFCTNSAGGGGYMGRRVDGGKLIYIYNILIFVSAILLIKPHSGAVRFRGAGHGTALGLAFLASNYIIERHREALLWSFLIARSDRDSCGTYSTRERIAILQELGFTYSESNTSLLIVPEPIRMPNDDVEAALTQFICDAQEIGSAVHIHQRAR